MATFTYTRDRPNPPNNPSADVPDMRTNNNSIDDIINEDHFSFGQSGKDGSHKQVTLTNEAAPGLGVGDGVLHANTYLGNSWPHWQNALGDFLILSGDTLAAANGYSFISQGILLQWGFNNAVSSGSFAGGSAAGTVSFPRVGGFPNNCFIVLPIPSWTTAGGPPDGSGSVNINQTNLSASGFSWKFNSNSSRYTGFYWFAIGN